MHSTGIDRRTLLKAAGFIALGSAAATRRAVASASDTGYVAARQEADGRYALAVFDADGIDRLVVPLPGRGHDIAVASQTGTFVAFARRPGRFAVAVQADRSPQTFAPPEDRHFYGHGAFSPTGDLLYATENDFGRQRGVIGVYASPDWRRLGELPAYGVGPHELLLMPDGETLAVANGGIATEPDIGDGRTAIGDRVASDLVLVDRRSGARRGQWRLPPDLADLSIRHLACDGVSNIWFGCQWEGGPGATPPLLGRLSASGDLKLLETSSIAGNLADYVGSMATDRGGTLVAASSPRAGMIAIVDAAAARIVGSVPLSDGCGIAADTNPRQFIATSGAGRIETLGVAADGLIEEPLRTASVRWDNHLRPVAI